jgi:glycosyltransferase involved in cell wall biosynthesis
MRIGYLVSQYPSPSHTFVRREVRALRGLGLEVDTFSVRGGESLSEDDHAEEVRTCYLKTAGPAALAASVVATLAMRPTRWRAALASALRLRLPGATNALRSIAYFVEAMHLARELHRRGVTHLHNHFANPASHVGLAAAQYLGIGWSMTVHGLTDLAGPLTPLLDRKIEAARFVLAVTHAGRDQAVRAAGERHADRVHVVRCGIEVDRLPPVRRRPPGLGEPLVILSVGRLAPEKGHVGLVEAFAAAVRRGVHAKLVLIGGGPEEARIRAAIAARGVADRVELRGSQPEPVVLDAMARAHLFALSSFVEGLPVVLMEALALELPVVAPAINGIPELVRHEDTGLLFEAGNWDALTDGLVRLARDPELAARLAAAGRLRVLSEFDVRRAVVPLARLFGAAHAAEVSAPPQLTDGR